MVKVPNDRLLWGLSAVILIGAFIVSPGFYSIDEAIYYVGARAVAEWGSLGIDSNGFAYLQRETLELKLLVEGPHGVTPQYPAGSALLAAPLLPFLGTRAFILLNAVSAVLMLFTVRKICLSQFKSETIWRITVGLLAVGTFWLEYAVAIWPHMLSAYFAVQAYWLALCHLDSDGKDYRDAILAGLFAGAGILFRLDATLAVPAVGLILIMYAPRIVRSSFLFGVGVLPSLALASWFSYVKFGSPNPLSYGYSGGNTDLWAHGPLLAAFFVGFVTLLLWRKVEWRPDRRATVASLVVLGGLLLAIPAANAWVLRFWNGFLALVVDIRNINDPRTGILEGPGNTLLFWTLVKKSLGQSMPWIGLTVMLLASRFQKGERRFITTLLIFIATMTMPFILLSWHGGGGSNLRYFLPILPALCILCAKLISDLWQSVPNAIAFATAGVWAAVALSLAWGLLHSSGYAGVQQILSTYFFVATALAATVAAISWRFQQAGRKLAIALFGSGFVISMTSALFDFRATAEQRAFSHFIGESVVGSPARSLVIASPEWTVVQMRAEDSVAAARDIVTNRVDPQLIINALDAGYRVFMTGFEFDATRDVPPGVEFVPTSNEYPDGRMIELRRRPAPLPAAAATDPARSEPSA